LSIRDIVNTESEGVVKWKDMELKWDEAGKYASITEKVIRVIRKAEAVRKEAVREIQSTIRGG